MPLKVVGSKLGTIFAQYATHDYPWALSLAFARDWKGSHRDFVRFIEKPFWDDQDRFREKWVKPYPGVETALQELQRLRIPAVVVSDAPMFMCLARLLGAGLSKYFQGVYALECKRPDASLVPDESWLEFGDKRVKDLMRKYGNHQIRFVRELPLEYEKPDPRGIQLAMADFNVTGGQVIHVGDSLAKDGVLGLNASLRGFFYTPYHAIPHLPPEYLHFITQVLKPRTHEFDGHGATPVPEKTKIVRPPMLGQGAFGDALNHLGFHDAEAELESTIHRQFRA